MPSTLNDAVSRYLRAYGSTDGLFSTAIDGLVVMRASGCSLPNHTMYRPALCLVVQGAKQVTFGNCRVEFGEMQSLIVSLELPAFGRVTRASIREPFLGLALELDTHVIHKVMDELDQPPAPSAGAGPGVFVQAIDGALADCFVRLFRILETPWAVPILYPAIQREICFWLLTGPYGSEVCKLALPDGHTLRIARAIRLLRERFAQPIRVKELAGAAHMSASSFHAHFKTLTAMTPLQYQKQLRLLEARRLMVTSGSNVAGAARHVGYESASQFSREYARMFGAPPKRDVSVRKALAV